VRISATDWVQGGWDVEDSIVFSMELKRRGCDYIAPPAAACRSSRRSTPNPATRLPLAQAVRQGAGIATMAVGQITEPRQAESILAEQKADMIAIARRLMFNPHWAWSAAAELGVFLKYPARYRNANPRIGQAMDFPESAEKRRRLLEVMREEARVSQARGW
jgi:2,4-dienoyl-CoA reductase-like NADH-dependent reductase (Old Yellow Enzyme family)